MSFINKLQLLTRYTARFPLVLRTLNQWRQLTHEMPCELRLQAQLSIESKAFHCIGGSIYALYPKVSQSVILKAIIALQTISDYLDNLCDRMNVNDERIFRQLHFSFTDALDPLKPMSDYYKYYPYKESVYLPNLVTTCRNQIQKMPYYLQYKPYIVELAENYCQLQVLKHLTPDGEECLRKWVNTTFTDDKHLKWNEWAAATGSTLGIFALFAASFSNYSNETAAKTFYTYFPWVQSLHILLDYFIDRSEDDEHNDLNFTFYYRDIEHAAERLHYLYCESKNQVQLLPHSVFHELVLQGLIAMYGSDPKLKQQNLISSYQVMLDSTSTRLLYNSCYFLRKLKYLV